MAKTAHSASKQLTGTGGLAVVLVTPRGPVSDTRTDAVTAPGELGEFEVFPGHVPFLTKLHPGVLKIGETNQEVFAVASGLLEVERGGTVRILVERAVPAAKVDVEAARAEIDATEPVLKDWKDPLNAEWKNLKARHDWAKAQLDARRPG